MKKTSGNHSTIFHKNNHCSTQLIDIKEKEAVERHDHLKGYIIKKNYLTYSIVHYIFLRLQSKTEVKF